MPSSQEWMPREQWDALVRGQGCPACAEVTSSEQANEQGFFVADLDFSRLRLAANQFVTGYCVLLCHRHVREPYELSKQERSMFFEDLTRVGRALERGVQPDEDELHDPGERGAPLARSHLASLLRRSRASSPHRSERESGAPRAGRVQPARRSHPICSIVKHS